MQRIPTSTPSTSRKRLWPRLFQIGVILLLMGLLSPLYPPFFHGELRALIRWIAFRNQIDLEVGRVSGTLWEPVRLREVTLRSKHAGGAVTEAKIESATLSFSWQNVVLRRGAGWFQKLLVEGADFKLTLPEDGATAGKDRDSAKPGRHLGRLPVPVELDARQVNVLVRQGEGFLAIEDMQFAFQAYASGLLVIKGIEIHHPDWEKRFSRVYGGIALQDEKICITDVLLEPGFTIDSLAVSLPDLEKGKLKSEFASRAFSGSIRGEILSTGRDKGRVTYDANGSFRNIAIGQLASFLSSQEKAEGTIKEGKFSFHGSPRNLPKATISTRFEATDFQWQQRKWNALVIGASLFDRRLQVPEFQLKQAHNSLSLKGEMVLPASEKSWWQADLAFDLHAKLDNLTELSDLIGPDFGEVAGKAKVEGNVRGQKGAYHGQFIVSGSNLSYRNAPLDVLNAAVTLRGNEIEISHAEFAHKDDYLRARGTVGLSAQRQYVGEVKASVADLTLYSSILQPPIAPHPFSGSLLLDWSGDGNSKSHSGAFRVRLKGVEPFAAPAGTPDYTLHADMEATYAPEHLYFGKLIIGDPQGNFSTKLTASPNSVKLEGIKIQQKGTVRMEGDAFLPLNIWKAWQAPGRKEVWDPSVACNVNLVFNQLNLHDSAAIFGREFPVRGDLQGTLATSGSINALSVEGKLLLSRGEVPLATQGAELREIEASLLLKDQSIRLEKFSARYNGQEFALEGRVDAGNLQDPGLDLAFRSKSFTLKPQADLTIKAGLDLQLSGSLTKANVTGQARLENLRIDHPLSIEPLFFGPQKLKNTVSFEVFPGITKDWTVDVHLTGTAATQLVGTAGQVSADARLVGSPKEARVVGQFDLSGFVASSARAAFAVQRGALYLGSQGDGPQTTSLFIQGNGTVDGKPFEAHILGSPEEPRFAFVSEPPFTEEGEFRKALTSQSPVLPPQRENPLMEESKPAAESFDLKKRDSGSSLPQLPQPILPQLTSP